MNFVAPALVPELAAKNGIRPGQQASATSVNAGRQYSDQKA
jgi:hypothetical protein